MAWFSPAGRYIGSLQGLPASGVDARRGQYRLFELPGVRLRLAREIIRAKIHNQRVMLMRNGDVPDRVLSLLANFRDAAETAADLKELLGIEGTAAAMYFEQFESMLKERAGWHFDWRGRNRRPPRDPMSARIRYLVSYDICQPKRLRQVARVLEGFGVRLQYSVFECPLDVCGSPHLRRLYIRF